MSSVIPLDEISGTDSENSGDNNGDTGAFSELRDTCDTIGADAEHAIERAKNDDSVTEQKLLDTAREIQNSEELWVNLENYRFMVDQKRILENYLRGHEKEFTAFASAFWGDTENPSEGTFNHVQQKVRGHDGTANLYYYKTLFPEPHAEHVGSEPVVWEERPDEDSHIYVTEEWLDSYADYTLELAGEERVVPPWDSVAGQASDESDDGNDVLDPREMTVDEIKDAIDERDLSMDELKQLKEAESATENRVTALQAIRRAIADIRTGEANETDDTADSDESDGKSPEAIAGKVLSRLSDGNEAAHPEVVMAMARDGKTEEEIVNILSA